MFDAQEESRMAVRASICHGVRFVTMNQHLICLFESEGVFFLTTIIGHEGIRTGESENEAHGDVTIKPVFESKVPGNNQIKMALEFEEAGRTILWIVTIM